MTFNQSKSFVIFQGSGNTSMTAEVARKVWIPSSETISAKMGQFKRAMLSYLRNSLLKTSSVKSR